MRNTRIQQGVFAAALLLCFDPASAFNPATLNAPSSCNICITTFAHGFPTGANAGPFGIAFLPNGKVLVTDSHSSPLSKLYLFPSDVDPSTAPPNCPGGTTGGFNAPSFEVPFNRGPFDHFGDVDLCVSFDGRIFATGTNVSGQGILAELTYDPVANSFTAGAALDTAGTFAAGMALDHVSGSIFYDAGGNDIRAFNPATNTGLSLFSGPFTQLDGMDVSADGQFLWVADVGSNKVTQFTVVRDASLQPVSLVSPVTLCTGLPGADGIARGLSGTCLQNFLFCNTNGGTIAQWDLTTNTCSTFLSGGTRGDFVKVSCKGWLYATQTDNIAIIRQADGSPLFECSNAPAPGSPTPTPTATDIPSNTPTDTATPTFTASATGTSTASASATPTSTATGTATASFTAASTPAVSPTSTATVVVSAVSTVSPQTTPTPSFTATGIPSASPTPTPFNFSTFTPSPTHTCPLGAKSPTPTPTPKHKCHPIPFPNPCHGEKISFRCEGGPYDEIDYELCSVGMRRVCRHTVACQGEETPELSWDLRDDRGGMAANGLYFLVVDTHCRGNVQRYVEKVLILR